MGKKFKIMIYYLALGICGRIFLFSLMNIFFVYSPELSKFKFPLTDILKYMNLIFTSSLRLGTNTDHIKCQYI